MEPASRDFINTLKSLMFIYGNMDGDSSSTNTDELIAQLHGLYPTLTPQERLLIKSEIRGLCNISPAHGDLLINLDNLSQEHHGISIFDADDNIDAPRSSQMTNPVEKPRSIWARWFSGDLCL